MARSRVSPFAYGAVAGVVIALGFFAFFAAYTSLETVDAVTRVEGTLLAEPVFDISSNTMWVIAGILGALGGLLIAIVTYAIGAAQEPDRPRFGFVYLAPLAMLIGGVMVYSAVRLGVSIAGNVSEGTAFISVAAMVGVVVVAGLIGGASVAPVTDALTRPVNVGAANEASPASTKQFWTDMGAAIGIPTISIIIGAALAASLAQVLLNADSMLIAVGVFSIVGAVILGGTALIALRPWDRENRPRT